MIVGKIIYVDSTHIKASANIGKFTNKQVEVPVPEYIDEFDKAVNESRERHAQKALKKRRKNGRNIK
ncbi:MAG: hypothetical protein AB7V48_00510 [Sedimentibacter sp.]